MGANAKQYLAHAELGSFFENMGMMVRAGISVGEACTLLRDETDPEDKKLHGSLNTVCGAMENGSTFEEALRSAGSFPDYASDMIRAAEYTGRVEDTLFHLSSYFRSEDSMRKTLTAAVRYPLILLVMVIAVLVTMLRLVFPAFYGVYSKLTGSLSSSAYRYIDISFTICRVLLVIMILLVVLLIAGILAWRNGNKEGVQRFLSRFRVFSELFEGLDLYRFTSCFDMFIASGELHDDAVKKSIDVTETPALKAKLARCVEKMEQGLSFSQAAYEERLYDSVNGRMLIPAERSGMLDSVLKKVLRNLSDGNEAKISRIANSMEPMLTGALMIFIGLMLISLMVPLIGIMNSIG